MKGPNTSASALIALPDAVRAVIREVPDFPIPGIRFKDITPLLAQPQLLARCIDAMAAPYAHRAITHVVAIESRGFFFGVPVALALSAAFVPARKPGKLPYRTAREPYALEYRNDALELHADALDTGSRVLLVDDVLATGGTLAAARRLIERLGGEVVGASVLLELAFLGGREALGPMSVRSIADYADG